MLPRIVPEMVKNIQWEWNNAGIFSSHDPVAMLGIYARPDCSGIKRTMICFCSSFLVPFDVHCSLAGGLSGYPMNKRFLLRN